MVVDLTTMFREADAAGVRLAIDGSLIDAVHGDAVLFDAVQIPVVAFAVVACISNRRGGEALNLIGARVGHALMSAFPAFARTGRLLQWSIRVRTVTVEALSFLEESDLIKISLDVDHTATMTDDGRKFLKKLRAGTDDAAQLFKLLLMAVDRTRNHDLRLL
jgi:hypothetical protein